MTTTNSLTPKRTDRARDVKGPIDTLRAQQVKLEEALKWADGHVEFTKNKAAEAENRRHEIQDDLNLTNQILEQYGINKPYHHVEIVVENANKGVVDAQVASEAFARRFVPRTFL